MWQEKDKKLHRKFEFKNFDEAFSFMQRVAEVAVSLDHHPDWSNSYNKVEIELTTHSEGGVTDKDKQFAERIDKIYDSMNDSETTDLRAAKLFTDGGARGNPGPSAIAFVICKVDETVVKKDGEYIGSTTNNQAEYRALEAGLKEAGKMGVKELQVLMDSELVVKQINGQYKVKNAELMPIYKNVKALADEFQKITFNHVPRALNKIADAEVNRILDEQSK
jgi:ribonuclease HI